MSAVKNIRFLVVLINANGANVNHLTHFQQPILFGCPINLQVGNTNITAGMAASLSTSALAFSMKQTVNKYGNKKVTSTMVDLYFESKLKYNYPNYLPGGRVNVHPQNYPISVVPTQYQSSAAGSADCE